MILSDEVSGKIDRVCCGAVKVFMGNKSSPFCTFLQDRVCVAMKTPVGLLSGRAVLRSKMEGRCPDKLGGICDKGYHGLRSASRWFCKFYCSKAVIVGLMKLIEYFFYGIARCCFWILPGRALENGVP